SSELTIAQRNKIRLQQRLAAVEIGICGMIAAFCSELHEKDRRCRRRGLVAGPRYHGPRFCALRFLRFCALGSAHAIANRRESTTLGCGLHGGSSGAYAI